MIIKTGNNIFDIISYINKNSEDLTVKTFNVLVFTLILSPLVKLVSRKIN